MDSEKMKVRRNNEHVDADKEEGGGKTPLPGFRFHPTDQELVGFYLRRKVDGKPLAIDLIKQIDIYKYDPWDLPRDSDLGDNEWYFFCKRGRKYRNSIRPNRVTASGFWKATGIDRPIYSPSGSVCIGLKKSLVYYRGSAGKGTKTQWMMHEFRLPPSSHNHMDDRSLYQEAEVWTLCRILKRNGCQRKTSADWRDLAAKRNTVVDSSSKTCSADSDQDLQSYISFQDPVIQLNQEKDPSSHYQHHSHLTNGMVNMTAIDQFTSSLVVSDEAPSSNSSVSGLDGNRFIEQGDWDDLRSAIDLFAAADRPVFFL